MDKMKRVSVEDRDNFVAYLDGELSPDEIKKLEGILADSPVARKDVEMLVRTYELLDLLPRPQATTAGSLTESLRAGAGAAIQGGARFAS